MTKKLSWFIILVVTVITALSVYLAARLPFDYDFEHFFPQDSEELAYFLEFRKQFENDNDYILIGIDNESGVFQKDFLVKVDSFCSILDTLPNVEQVLSPTRLQELIISPLGPVRIPLLRLDSTAGMAKDSARIFDSDEWVGTYFSEDGKSICVVLKNKQIIKKRESDELLSALKQTVAGFQFDHIHLTGKVIAQEVYLRKMKTELLVFVSSSMVLVLLFLFIAFRSFWGVVVPVITVMFAIVWVLGFMYLTGGYLDLMTSLLPTILFVVGMSDAVHLISRYLDELRNGTGKIDAIRATVRDIGMATMLTSLTTAIGFFTLMTINIKPIKEFGFYVAIGVFIAYIIAILFIPSALYNLPRPRITRVSTDKLIWNKVLRKVFLLIVRNQRKIIWIYGAVIVLCLAGASQIKVNYFLLQDLDEEVPLKQDLNFFSEHYAGGRPFEMIYESKGDGDVLSYQAIKQQDKVDRYLREEYGIGFIVSPVNVVKTINKALHNGSVNYYKVPESRAAYNRVKKHMEWLISSKAFPKLISEDRSKARFTGKMGDIGSYEAGKRSEALLAAFNGQKGNEDFNLVVTGTATLIDSNQKTLARNMLFGLGIAFMAIALIAGILFRSYSMAIISLIPNIIPLLIIAGIIGMAGIDMNISTSIIFTISFGIAVDDTIHFLSKMKLEMQSGKHYLYALKRTYLSTGRAIVITTLILCAGFLMLILSDFRSTHLIGLLVSLTLLFAVLTDLLVLPVLLIYWGRKKQG